jgi:hypothetical protein
VGVLAGSQVSLLSRHHLTLPLLRNGPHPLPRFAAEWEHEQSVSTRCRRLSVGLYIVATALGEIFAQRG